MARPVTLFTGQWADMPLDDLARKGREFGYQGLELACWGDHFDVTRALEESGYCAAKRDQPATRSPITWSARPSATGSTSGTSRSSRRTSGATETPPV